MFPGEFFRTGLRRDENDRQIKMRIGIIRVVGESLKDLLLCLLLSPFLAGGDTQIVVSGSALWIDRDRFRAQWPRLFSASTRRSASCRCEHKRRQGWKARQGCLHLRPEFADIAFLTPYSCPAEGSSGPRARDPVFSVIHEFWTNRSY